MSSSGTVTSVNVGVPRPAEFGGREVATAIWKSPVSGPVAVRGVNLAGDDQADRRVHGGPDKAVYAYAEEDLDWWAAELRRPLPPGSFGENLTTAGMALTGAVVGERWAVGTSLLQVTQPRLPCYKLGIRMGEASFPDRFLEAGRTGAYLRIVGEGTIAAGQTIEVTERPDHGLTVTDILRIYTSAPGQASRLLEIPDLPETWVRWARKHSA